MLYKHYLPLYNFAMAEGDRPYLGCSSRSMIDKDGMMILLVNSESPASKNGLRIGDVIIEIDGQEVNNINDYYAALAKSASKMKTFKVVRQGEERIFKVPLE